MAQQFVLEMFKVLDTRPVSTECESAGLNFYSFSFFYTDFTEDDKRNPTYPCKNHKAIFTSHSNYSISN